MNARRALAACLAAILLAPCALALGAAPSPVSAVAEAKSLTLKVSGTAHGPNVLLKDVVAEELPEPLASQALKAAGKPGSSLSVPRALVQLKLKTASKAAWDLKGAEICNLSVPAQSIAGSQIQAFAADFLRGQLSGTAGATLEAKAKPADLSTYDAATRFEIKPGGQDWRGVVVLRVQVMQPGAGGEDHEVASVPVSFLVRRQEPRVYASKALHKGDVLDAGVLTLRNEDTTFAQGQGFASLEEVIGKRVRAYIAPGKAVTADLVEIAPLIRRGDMVRLLIKSGGVLIETQGKAMRDARLGETLPLELEETKKQVQARCVEAGVAVKEAF